MMHFIGPMTREPLPLLYEPRVADARRSYITRWSIRLAPVVFPVFGILMAAVGLAYSEQAWPDIGSLWWVGFIGMFAWLFWFLLGIGLAAIGPSFLQTDGKGMILAIYIVLLAIVAFFSFRLGMNSGI